MKYLGAIEICTLYARQTTLEQIHKSNCKWHISNFL